MSEREATPADRAGIALKADRATLDSCRVMRTQELKLRVQRSEYAVDPSAVADAMLRHAVAQRRWWNPTTDWGSPAASSATPGSPATTDPTHVIGAAASAPRRSPGATHTHSS